MKPWEGGCVCGAVRYKITAKPEFGLVCPCTWCQRRSGSAFSFVAYCKDADVEYRFAAVRTELENLKG